MAARQSDEPWVTPAVIRPAPATQSVLPRDALYAAPIAGAKDEFGGTIGEGRTRTIRVPCAVSSVPRVRRAVVADLRARGLSAELVGESEIVVSELVANSVRHARPLHDGNLRVHWRSSRGAVEVEVTDGGGPTVPRPSPQSAYAPAGRGLRIVRSLAHEWGVRQEDGDSTVWAALGGPSKRRGVV